MLIEQYGVWAVDTSERPLRITMTGPLAHGSATLEEFLAGGSQDIDLEGVRCCRCAQVMPRADGDDPLYNADEAALFDRLDRRCLAYTSGLPFRSEISFIQLLRCRTCGAYWYALEQHRENSAAQYEKGLLVAGLTMALPT
jgi:hypothetical protein